MKSSAVMRPVRRSLAGVAALVALCVAPMPAQMVPPPKYPATARGPQSDDVSGVRFADPYRWLENVGSPDVRAWAAAQSAVTEAYLAELPRRREMRNLIAREWKYPDVSAPFGAGERLFFYEQNGRVDNQPVLYVRDRPESPPRVLIDPNAFSHDGLIAIVDQAASPNGRFLAYAVALQGSAWRTVRIRDVRSGLDQAEELHGIRDSRLSWTQDERGFFYTRSDSNGSSVASNVAAPPARDQIVYHRVGHPQADDQLVYDDPRHPEWRLRADVGSDGEYLVIAASNGVHLRTRMYFIDLDAPKHPNLGAPIVKLFDTGDAEYEFVANDGPVFFIRTTKDAPRGRLVAVDINSPDEAHWTTTVRETYDPLVAVRRLDDRFVVHRLHDAHSVLEVYTLSGAARGAIPLPGNGTVTEMNPRSNYRELYFRYSAFLQPPVIYRYDLETKIAATYTEVPADTSLLQYETTQLYFTSKDGTRVPMFITARRGITLDGSHATLLTGTGSFGRAATPAFSPFIAAWLELGGIYAVANVRGGGEYGRAWHVAAIGTQKQVAADDFVGAAQFLIGQRYTRPSMLGVVGHGAAGLLAGIAITQHPELFAGAVLDAPLLDMARFNRFAIGGRWTPEFGSPDAAADLRALLGYSPLHNLRGNARYPATLITVGDHDEVATPVHAYKFAAALQSVQIASLPALLLVESDVGFGPGTPATKQIAFDGDRLAFLQNFLRGGR
jgi:prolyl oligopeptidase